MKANWEDFKNESTTTLIEMTQLKDESDKLEIAGAAFSALCFRFQTEIITNIRIVVVKWGYDVDVADEIAYNAFARFWKYPKFNVEKCTTSDIDKCFIFYIHKICRRLLIDHRKNVINISDFNGDEEVIFDFPQIEDTNGNVKKTQLIKIGREIERALNKLGPKHKAIYLTYKAYEKTGKKLPRTLLEKLRIELKISQSTIRFYKKEANEIVEKIITEHEK